MMKVLAGMESSKEPPVGGSSFVGSIFFDHIQDDLRAMLCSLLLKNSIINIFCFVRLV